MKPELRVSTDPSRNRIHVLLSGFFSDEDMKMVADTMIQEVDKLGSNFDIITDISKFKPATLQGTEELKRAQDYIKTAGVRKVVRIVDKAQALGQKQFDRKSKEAGYTAATVASFEEAEAILSSA